jgi:SAM-dependent methyltransferase
MVLRPIFLSAVATMATPIAESTESDHDSGCGSHFETEDESVRSSLYSPIREHGRGYHRLSGVRYNFPQDKEEQDRLNFQHGILLEISGDLYKAPIQNPQSVLDLGTGTGIWSIDFADRHPASNVCAVDISPIQPMCVPPNCRFQVYNYDQPWNFPEQDFIFMRLPFGSIFNFRTLVKQVFTCLKPGGWFEVQDICPPTSDDGTIPDDSCLKLWIDKWCEALHKLGHDPYLITKFEEEMRTTGFEKIESILFKIPQNTWPKDKHLKMIGRLNYYNVLDGIEGWSQRPLMDGLEWSWEQMQALLAGVRPDLGNRNFHTYWPL